MSIYLPTVPTGTVQLDADYRNVQRNFSQLDISFGVDHYAFSSQTNNGFHNVVTTPVIVGAAHPATAVNVPKFYTMKDGTNGATIQYSRAGNNAVPSPVTYVQSPAAAFNMLGGATSNVYDFTGITNRAIATFYLLCKGTFNQSSNFSINVFWNGATFIFTPALAGNGIFLQGAGNILQLATAGGQPRNSIAWTLKLLRVQT